MCVGLAGVIFYLALLTKTTASYVHRSLSSYLDAGALLLDCGNSNAARVFPSGVYQIRVFMFSTRGQYIGSDVLPRRRIGSHATALPPLTTKSCQVIYLKGARRAGISNVTANSFNQVLFTTKSCFSRGRITNGSSLCCTAASCAMLPCDNSRRTGRAGAVRFTDSRCSLSIRITKIPTPKAHTNSLPILRVYKISPYASFRGQTYKRTASCLLRARCRTKGTLLATHAGVVHRGGRRGIGVHLDTTPGKRPLTRIGLTEFLTSGPVVSYSGRRILVPVHVRFGSKRVAMDMPR